MAAEDELFTLDTSFLDTTAYPHDLVEKQLHDQAGGAEHAARCSQRQRFLAPWLCPTLPATAAHAAATAKASGIGVPENEGARPPQERLFLRAALRLHFHGGPGGGTFGCAGPFVPVRQPCFGPPPFIGVEGGG
jgi:hypothetical protein